MSMYLSNPALHTTGSEPGEYLDEPAPRADHRAEPAGNPASPVPHLDRQTRLNITRWAHEYIAGLVENHDGGPEDVRSIIHELHDEPPIAGRRDRFDRLPGGDFVSRWV
jgi:hypothetical protein